METFGLNTKHGIKAVPSVGKVMAIVFRDQKAWLLVTFLEKGATMNSAVHDAKLEKV